MPNIMFTWALWIGIIAFIAVIAKIWKPKKKDLVTGLSLVVAVVGVAGVMGWIAMPSNIQLPVAAAPGVPGAPQSGNNIVCPTTMQTSGYARIEDTIASSLTYKSGSDVYWQRIDTGEYNNKTSLSSGYHTAITLSCGKNYKVVAATQSDSASSAEQILVVSGESAYIDLKGKGIDYLQMRVKDIATDVWLLERGKDSNSYFVANASTVNATTSAYGQVGTIDANANLDYKIVMKTKNSNKVNGEDGLRNWLCVDAATDKWQEPVISFAGVKRANAKATMFADDLLAGDVSGSEYCYDLGQIGDAEKELLFYIKTKSGVNPGSSDDIVLYFAPEGRYLSQKIANTFKIGAYDDSTSVNKVSIVDADAQITIDVTG